MTNRFRLVCDILVPSSKFLCHWHWDRNKIVLSLETNNFDPKNPKHHLKCNYKSNFSIIKYLPVILWHCDKSMAVIFLQLIENISTVESVTFWHPRKIRARKKPPHLKKKKLENSLIYKTKEKIMRYGREGEGS